MLSPSRNAPSTLTRVLVGRRYASAHPDQFGYIRLHPHPHTRRPCPPLLQLRSYTHDNASSPERIAIFGGGISGLASAYYVQKEFPRANITIFESSKRTGGWIRSRRIDVGNNENVVFESGPRTLRNATVTASLVQELGLTNQVIYTDKSDPAARKRYIYYPDCLNLLPTQLPSRDEFLALWKTGILAGITGIVGDFFRYPRDSDLVDESVGAFISRRFHKKLAENIVSAGFHGIYAGDINQLSVKSTLGSLWAAEGRYGTVLGGLASMQGEHDKPVIMVHPNDYDMIKAMNQELRIDDKLARKMNKAAMFTFKDGLETLVKRLQDAVVRDGQVEIKTLTPVHHSALVKEGAGIEVSYGSKENPTTSTFDLAISTLPNASLTPHVTVQIVTFYFDTYGLLPVEGFGYLIPQSVPFEQNPERALGVIFDSCAVQGQDDAFGTKVTVMLGGHWWDGWTSYPTKEEGFQAARDVLARHLKITEKPVAQFANLAKNCIPQYTVGYSERLAEFAKHMSSTYQGRLRVVGSQFNGVGVNDCIKGAWSLARGLRGTGWKSQSCGLERALDEREWQVVPRSEVECQVEKPQDD